MKSANSGSIIRNLFPTPRQIDPASGHLSIPAGRIVAAEVGNPAVYRATLELQADLASIGISREIAAHPGTGQAAAIELRIDAEVACPQGYRIDISPARAVLTGHDPAGLTFATTTFGQLLRGSEEKGVLPCLTITDWPEFERRGIMLDISRDKVPTMETLYQLVDKFAAWKLNELQLYTEHTFAYANHRTVWEEASPMTPEEIVALDAYCRERGVDLVPNQNTFGHLERWLKHDTYAHLAECRKPTEVVAWGRTMTVSRRSLCPEDPGSIQLMEELFCELLPNFSSPYFNIGCDETIELGYGRSKEVCAEKGNGRVYLEFLLRLHKAASAHGRRVQFWGDIITNYPELIPELPKEIIALVWGYEFDHPFDQECAAFQASGLEFYVCPGTSSWTSMLGRYRNATQNLRSAAENGARHGAKGYLITDWGDGGHWQPLSLSYPYFAYGAALSWAPEANREVDLAGHLDRQVFQDSSGRIGTALLKLGQAAELSGISPHNSTIFFHILRQAGTRLANHDVLTQLESGMLDQVEDAVKTALATLAEATPTGREADQVKAEIDLVGRLAIHACRQARAKLGTPNGDLEELPDDVRAALRNELGELIEKHRDLWGGRNRPGGLRDSVDRFEKVWAEY